LAGLQVLEETFGSQGFHVLGFFENNFGAQGGTPGQVDMCTSTYHVTFPEFEMNDVVGASAQPVWQWLLAQPNPGPAPSIQPSWNFNKYLISKDGQLMGHWAEQVYPGDDPNVTTDSFDTSPIVIAIKSELAK
jgi:glutathione peroxidase